MALFSEFYDILYCTYIDTAQIHIALLKFYM